MLLINSITKDPDLPVELKHQPVFKDIIGESDKLKEIFQVVEKVSESDSTIIITGESGTGKGLIAKAIHQNSSRKNKPFISINCGAIPENLLESELFGHVRGAFTGATSPKPGKFELADGGTVFLDEIGDMSNELQIKVLRALEEKSFERVGGCKTIKVNARIIAATHRNLKEEIKKGNFREDLFYRLYVIPINIPPLRERREDISLLVSHFLDKFNKKNGLELEGFTDESTEIILSYSWPGNIRELRNMLERLVILKRKGLISPQDLPENMRMQNNVLTAPNIQISDDGISLNTAVNEFEKALILQSLEKTKWVKNKAAKLLQLNRTTLVEKIKRHQLQHCHL
ncbi:MAG: sigma-54-dependent Fis family transcriptional regulator [Deltaproteobacteria bacterium]|nr:sigma-54-dependent Fis family transcriptional regulator [Deltaproteobacteria bacterium]